MQERVCIVTTHRTLPEETLLFVNYHLNLGFDRIFLFFDDPNDKALALIENYPRLVCFRCDREYWARLSQQPPASLEARQIVNANAGWELAKEKGFGWVMHIDSDELVYTETSIPDLFSGISDDVDAARFEVLEAVPDKLEYARQFVEPKLFRASPTRENVARALSLGCRKAFFEGEYFRGHTNGKSAVRVASSRIDRLDIHLPFPKENQSLHTETLTDPRLLHYDAAGFKSWREKWTKRASGETQVPTMRENRQEQLGKFMQLYRDRASDDEFASLYQSLYFIPDEEKRILFDLGMLRQINVNERLFAAPSFLAS